MTNKDLRLSKSQIDTHEQCPRKWFLKYAYGGAGIEPDGLRSMDLSKGVAIHKGIERLFAGDSIDAALTAAFAEFDADLAQDKVAAGVTPVGVITENKMVVEACLRLWNQVRLPALRAEYDYVAGEYEMTTRLSDTLSLYARPDAVLRSKQDGRLFNWSLKTERSHNTTKHPTALIDTGGLTEAINMAMVMADGELMRVGGTLMEYVVAGRPDDDEPIIWHPGVHGWRRPTDMGGFAYAWRWKFANPDHDLNGPKGPKNPETRSLAKKEGWERFNACDYPGGIAAWCDALLARKFTPQHLDPRDELFYFPPAYVRTQSALLSFVEQTIAEYSGIPTRVERVANGQASVDAAFPKRRYNCLRYGAEWRCPYWAICHEGLNNPIGNGFRLHRKRDEAAAEPPETIETE